MTTTKLGRRERQQILQRQEILAAAAELFSENGYHNVSMDEIARRAEFGKGTLYKFFPNKEELFTALMFETIQGVHNTIMAVLGQDKDPVEIIHENAHALNSENVIVEVRRQAWRSLPKSWSSQNLRL